MMRKTNLLWAIAAAALPGAACGQDQKGSIEQIGTRSAAPVEQIGGRGPVSDDATPDISASQLGTGAEKSTASAQVTAERGNPRGSAQLYTGGRTAQPADALSRPSEGRTGAAAAVGGSDRCDPARRPGRADEKACARVIETRAGEFARQSSTEFTVEQKLLIEQRGNQASNTRDAARQLGDTGMDAGSLEAQGVASVVLRGGNLPPETGDPSGSSDPGVNAAALNAIVNAIAAGANGGSTPR